MNNPMFYEARQPAPVCNHDVQDIGPANLGYTTGILSNGTPFEAELWVEDGQKGISIFLPEKNKRFFEQEEIADDNTDDVLLEIPEKMEFSWPTLLAQGMIDREINDSAAIKYYVEYLLEYNLYDFVEDECNGNIHFLTDIEGNDLVCVDVILEDKGEVLATTNLHFRHFPGAPTKKSKLKLVKDRR